MSNREILDSNLNSTVKITFLNKEVFYGKLEKIGKTYIISNRKNGLTNGKWFEENEVLYIEIKGEKK